MAYEDKKAKIDEVRQLTQEGYTQDRIAEIAKVPPRTQRHWKKEGYLGTTRFMPGRIRPTGAQERTATIWPDITAVDLVTVGFKPERTPAILATLMIAREQGNDRLPRFLTSLIKTRQTYPKMPLSWSFAIAGFPIVAEDINAPSLSKVAALVAEIHPYMTKESRREYHRRARPALVGVMAEVQAFLQDAAMVGGMPMAIVTEPPNTSPLRDMLTLHWEYQIDDALEKGKWGYIVPQEVVDIPLEETWAGILYDIVSRLPDPDRQRGKLRKKWPLMGLLYMWCATAPRDFQPALPIKRSATPSGLAGVYMDMREHAPSWNKG